jgi:hypothetical protein
MAETKEFAKPLVLTTPEMTGQPVRDAQYLMQGHSRFGKGLAPLKDAKVDGIYGPTSAAATKSTKYWLGYPESACDGVFGQTLYDYLRPKDWAVLPKPYQTRRAQRLAAQTPGQMALALAVSFIGTKESPTGSNRQMFGAWYGFNGVPWCAIFESYCFAHSGYAKYRYASVAQIVADARAGRNGLRIVQTPQPGDVVAYTIHGDPYAHTAFFRKWLNQKTGQFQDLGGNTGPSDISNGGEVLAQTRSTSMVTNYIRVGR